MKKNKSYILLITLVFSLLGCDNYLSELPDNRTIIDSEEKISALITGAYPDGNYMLITELMSDNATEKVLNGGDQLDTQIYTWEDTNLEDRDSPTFYWNSCYEAIAQANQALQSIEDLSSDMDLDTQKGEALLARAYAHFMLVNLWAKHYDPSSADTDLGIPYVTEPETLLIQEYSRNTVQEVYELIEEDLLEGIELVGNEYDEPRFHFTENAANAFAVRFYTYKAEWEKVIEYANLVISNPSNEIRDDDSYRDLSYAEILRVYANATDERTNLLLASTASLWARKFASSRYGLSSTSQNLFSAENITGKSWSYRVFGTDLVNNLPKFEEYFKITNQSAGTGLPFLGIILFDKDEVLLNRAEAYSMQNNFTAALDDINAFLSLKTVGYDASTDALEEIDITNEYAPIDDEFTPAYTLTDAQTSFIKAIAEFKRREYYHEGLRWFDIKRFQLEVTHSFNGNPIILEKEDLRKQLQIPLIAQNFGVAPNPR